MTDFKNKTPVVLRVEDFQDREVSSITYSFNQRVDEDGQVVDYPKGGLIVMRLKALNKPNHEILNWMLKVDFTRNGKIIFYRTTNGNVLKTIEFQDAYCVNYVEHWEDDVYGMPLAHWEDITISCRIIQVDSDEFSLTNQWHKLATKKEKKQPNYDAGTPHEQTGLA